MGLGETAFLVQVIPDLNLGGGADFDQVAGRLKEGPSSVGRSWRRTALG